MSESDPYFVVRDDVNESLLKTGELLSSLLDLREQNGDKKRIESIAKDVRNSVRSIEWDLEDLQETIKIVEQDPHKFNLSHSEVTSRKQFVSSVRRKLTDIKQKLEQSKPQPAGEKKSLLNGGQDKSYHSSAVHDANVQFIEETKQQQELMIRAQDEQIDNIGASVKVLKNISTNIGTELEEQSLLLDEFGHEMNQTDSKMDDTMKKIAKVTRMSSDKRQWCAIGILVLLILILIVLLAVLK